MTGSLMNEKEAAERLTVSVAWLRKQRLFSRPPAYHKLGGTVRYHVDDLDAYLKQTRVEPATNRRAPRAA